MNTFASELVKLRTIRTTWILLLVSTLISGGVAAALVGSGTLGEDARPAISLVQGAGFGTLFAAVVGILIVTNEYRHGTVMTTFLAEPNRVRVLLAKLAAAVVAGVVFAAAALAVASAVALPWLAARDESLPLDGDFALALGRATLAFVLTVVIGAAVGAIVHSQVGAIVGYFVWIFVFESIVTLVSGWLLTELGEPDPISKFLPGSALSGIVGGEGQEFVLDGGPAALLALAYAIGLSALGALSMTRRDP